MTELAAPIGRLLHRLAVLLPAVDVITLGAIVLMVAATLAIEAATGGRPRRYFSRNAWTDVLYTLFYLGGFYAVFVSGPISRALNALVSAYAPFLRLNLVQELPGAAQAALVIVLGDGTRYWVHRWTHANRWLWAFHRIHHSQDELTPWTNFRAHFGDFAVHSVALFGFGLVLGPSLEIWAPLSVAMIWLSLLAHSGWDWSFGPLDRVLVSPRYHSIHHSVEPQHFERNFGMLFSVWDYLFGTADKELRRPRAFGLPGPRLPESFCRQLVVPFLWLAGWRPRRS